MYVGFTKDKDLEYRWNWSMLTLKLQAKDFWFTLLPNKLKSAAFQKQRQDQSFSKLNTLDLSLVDPTIIILIR